MPLVCESTVLASLPGKATMVEQSTLETAVSKLTDVANQLRGEAGGASRGSYAFPFARLLQMNTGDLLPAPYDCRSPFPVLDIYFSGPFGSNGMRGCASPIWDSHRSRLKA